MCGIAGIVNFEKVDNYATIRNIFLMSNSIKHRGEDDEGYTMFNETGDEVCLGGENTPDTVWNFTTQYKPTTNITQANNNFRMAICHRRLSIVDLSPHGHQPMCSLDKNYWITYNGEIYNYIELRKELENKGYLFKTRTDTEVLLYAYIEWGIELHSKLNGMWSFVVFDKKKNILFGSRDRFGVKPFYYLNDAKKFIFASEIKGILSYPGIQRSINNSAAFDYLATGISEKEPESLFKGIFELQPSHFFELNLNSNRLSIKKYYTLETNDSFNTFDYSKNKEYLTEIQSLIFQSVNNRLSSEVSIGSTLSGGIDSTTILSCIGKLHTDQKFSPLNNNFSLYTSEFNESIKDETHWAKIAYEQNKNFTDWHKNQPKKEDIPYDIEKLIAIQDIPFFSLSAYSHYKLMKSISAGGTKVVLDGQGGDELFAGYNLHFSIYLRDILKNKSLSELYNNLSFNRSNSFSIKKSDISFLIKNIAVYYSLNKYIQQYQSLLKNKFYFNEKFSDSYPKKIETLLNKYHLGLNSFLKEEFTGTNLKTLLRVCDRNSMAFAIENRTPFADDIKLIEKIFSIPSVYKIRNNQSKYLLRESMNSIIPDAIKNRVDKVGFATPEYKWFKSNENYFLDYFNHEDEFINYKKIKQNWKSYDTILKTDISRIWRITNFLLWKKAFKI